MKKSITLLLVVLFLCLSACKSETQSENSSENIIGVEKKDAEYGNVEINFFEENGVSEYIYYEKDFVKYFSPEEYLDICSVATSNSSTLEYAISSNAFLVHQKTATYNSVSESNMIMDINGNVLKDYGENSWVTSCSYHIKMGNYTLVKTNGVPSTYDIVNENGIVVGVFDECSQTNYYASTISIHADLGRGFWLFSNKLYDSSSYYFYILNSSGEYFKLETPGASESGVVLPYMYISDSMEKYTDVAADEVLKVGKVSEDCFSMLYGSMNGSPNVCALYFDTTGKKVIDLSTVNTSYYVTALGEFTNGKAEITFRGADSKHYTAYIDKNGDLVGEPIQK